MRISTRPNVSTALLDYGLPSFNSGHGIVACHGFATKGLYLSTTCQRAGRARAGAVTCSTEIVDHNLRAALCQFQGIDSPEARAAPVTTATCRQSGFQLQRLSRLPSPKWDCLSKNSL